MWESPIDFSLIESLLSPSATHPVLVESGSLLQTLLEL